MSTKSYAAILTASALAFGATSAATAGPVQTIDFDDLTHGQVVDNEYSAQGVTISAINLGGGPNLAVAFDSSILGATEDPDLQFDGGWTGGNIADEALGRLLIIQENDAGVADGVADRPDDEAGQPAGVISFTFDKSIDSLGFDLIDFQNVEANDSSVTLFGNGGPFTINFTDFSNPGQFNVAGFERGDRTANRVPMIDFASLGLTGVDRVDFNFGGSFAVDNIAYTMVPTPSAAGAGILGLFAMLGGRRRRSA
ncbi:MAG: hypothetical protein AAF823_10155 [Planctomycetota bacterium]